VQAIDDRTLKVTRSGPVPYFMEIIGGTSFYPLKESWVERFGSRYAAEADSILANGPFQLTEWVHGASLKLTANPQYWNPDAISLSGIDIGYITSDARTLLNLFTGNEIATFNLDRDTLSDASEAGIRLRQFKTGCAAMLTFNFRPGRATANRSVRQAIQAVFDPEVYVNRIIAKPGNRASFSVFPGHLRAVGKPFHRRYPPPRANVDAAEAQRYLALAKQELGSLPELTILAWEGMDRQVEYLQGLFKEKLGLHVKIDNQTFKQAIVKLIGGDFDIALNRFCSSMKDPVFFAELYESSGTFNDGRYANAEYDRLITLTRESAHPQARMDAFGRIQQILFDDVVILPTHEVGQVYAQDQRLTQVQRWPGTNFNRSNIP
jgi:oligopeptide transport system substrate-binding protein